MNARVDPQPRPQIPPFSGLPESPALDLLRAHNHWVAWDYVWKAEKQKWDKPPINPCTGFGASHSDPTTWTSYEQAAAWARAKGFAGVGFVLAGDDNLTGLDLDHCRDPDTGRLDALATEVVALAETYCEVSPSGEGLRLFALGKVDRTTKSDAAGVEIYREQRYLTCTGNHVTGTPDEIRPAPRTLDLLLRRVAQVAAAAAADKPKDNNRQSSSRDGDKPSSSSAGFGRAPFWAAVNAAAFANLSAWVLELFGSDAKYQPSTRGYRVTSKSLGRDLEEDLSITPDGCVDFGVADQGDAHNGRRSAIDLVIQFGHAANPTDAALWLCRCLHAEPQAFGWNDRAARTSGQASPLDWPEPQPLPSGLLPVDPFNPAMIPTAIGAWVMDIAERMQCPPDFVAVSAMVALSAVIGRKIAVRPQTRTDWTEVPNL